jgi:hypothetical protein
MALEEAADVAIPLCLAGPTHHRAWAAQRRSPQMEPPPGLTRLTDPDTQQWRLTHEEWQATRPPRGLSPSPGPRIVVQKPQVTDTDPVPTIETGTPTDLEICLEATQAPVDRHSLQVRASQWLLTTSLTALLQPYIRGTTIQAHQVPLLPPSLAAQMTHPHPPIRQDPRLAHPSRVTQVLPSHLMLVHNMPPQDNLILQPSEHTRGFQLLSRHTTDPTDPSHIISFKINYVPKVSRQTSPVDQGNHAEDDQADPNQFHRTLIVEGDRT